MKTKINSGVTVTLLLLFGFSTMQAQDSSLYSLDQCMQAAIKNNPSVKAGMYEVDLQNKLKQTSTDIGKTNVMMMYGQYNSAARNDNNFSVNQTLPFPTLFFSNAAYHNAQIKGSELKLDVTKNELLYNVKSTYQQLQFLHAYNKLLTQQDSAFTEFARLAVVRYNSGEATLLEKITAESRLQEVRNSLFQNKSNIEIYLTQLKTLMNTGASFGVLTDDFKRLDLVLNTSDSAYANNPLVNYFKQQIEIAEAESKVQVNRMMPDITLGYFNQTLIGVPVDNSFATSSNRFQGVQVGLSIPLWFAPQTAKINAAKINEEIAKSNFEAQQNAMEGHYRQMIQEYLKLKTTLEYFDSTQMPQSKLIAQQSQKAFKAGEIGYYEHSQNLMQVLQIQSSYLTTLHQYNQSVYQIQFITGSN